MKIIDDLIGSKIILMVKKIGYLKFFAVFSANCIL